MAAVSQSDTPNEAPGSPAGPPGASASRRGPSAGRELSSHLLDRFLVRRLGDRVYIPGNEIHIGLENRRDLMWLIGLDDHEPRAAAGQGVPRFDSLGMVRAQLVLLNQPS